jgi:hypothetical protein
MAKVFFLTPADATLRRPPSDVGGYPPRSLFISARHSPEFADPLPLSLSLSLSQSPAVARRTEEHCDRVESSSGSLREETLGLELEGEGNRSRSRALAYCRLGRTGATRSSSFFNVTH